MIRKQYKRFLGNSSRTRLHFGNVPREKHSSPAPGEHLCDEHRGFEQDAEAAALVGLHGHGLDTRVRGRVGECVLERRDITDITLNSTHYNNFSHMTKMIVMY